MKVKVSYAVEVELEVNDKYGVLTEEPDEKLMDELEKYVIANSPFENATADWGNNLPIGTYGLVGVYSFDEDLAMLEY